MGSVLRYLPMIEDLHAVASGQRRKAANSQPKFRTFPTEHLAIDSKLGCPVGQREDEEQKRSSRPLSSIIKQAVRSQRT